MQDVSEQVLYASMNRLKTVSDDDGDESFTRNNKIKRCGREGNILGRRRQGWVEGVTGENVFKKT